MKIKMISLAKGPGISLLPEREYDVPEKMAQQLVAGGYAVEVKQKTTAPTMPTEEAVLPENPVGVKKAPAAKKKTASAKKPSGK